MISEVSNPQPIDETYRGLLYKIKDSQTKKTKGYLFGTFHYTLGDNSMVLNQKVYKCLAKCRNLFLELAVLDKDILKKEVKKLVNSQLFFPLLEKPSEKVIEDCVDSIINQRMVDKNRGAEILLSLKAMEENIPICSLETQTSRKRARKIANEQLNLIKMKVKFCDLFSINQAALYIKKICETKDFEKACSYLIKGCKALIDATQNITYKQHQDSEEPEIILFSLIETYDKLMSEFGCDRSIINGIKRLFIQEKRKQAEISNQKELYFPYEKSLLAWKKGSDMLLKEYAKCPYPKDQNVDYMLWQTHMIEVYERDTHMLEQMDRPLKNSSEDDRIFIAIGSLHLCGDYENLKMRLEKRGWSIVKGYKEL